MNMEMTLALNQVRSGVGQPLRPERTLGEQWLKRGSLSAQRRNVNIESTEFQSTGMIPRQERLTWRENTNTCFWEQFPIPNGLQLCIELQATGMDDKISNDESAGRYSHHESEIR